MICITGGLGVIGSLVAEQYLRNKCDVVIIDAAEEPRNHWVAQQLQEQWGTRVTIYKQRMETMDLRFVCNADLVLHAAAHTGIPHSATAPDDDWISNVEATRKLLETYRQVGDAPPTVVLSSVKPYRVHDLPVIAAQKRYVWAGTRAGIDETYPLEPDEPYAASKLAQSALCMAYARTYNMPVVVLRCSNLYGAAPCHGPRHGWLTWFCISAGIGRPIEVQGTGLQVRDMLHARDVARAVDACRQYMTTLAGNVYNIGGGRVNALSVIEAAEAVVQAAPETRLTQGPGRKHEDPIFIADHQRFTDVTAWRPGVRVHAGIDELVAWARVHSDMLRDLYKGF